MLLPLDEALTVPVSLAVVGRKLVLHAATLVRVLPDLLLLDVADPIPLGSRLVATLTQRNRVAGRAVATHGTVVTMSRELDRLSDDRGAPRAEGPIPVRWRLEDDTREAEAFQPAGARAEVSVSGLRFEVASPGPGVGSILAIEIEGRFAARGVVRRVDHQPADRITVAVELLDIPDDTLAALVQLTLSHPSDG